MNEPRDVRDTSRDTTETPSPDYVAGYRQANSDAGKCGAYNFDDPPPDFALCIRPGGHTGKHDDSWRLWGDRDATSDDNYRDAGRSRARWRQ